MNDVNDVGHDLLDTVEQPGKRPLTRRRFLQLGAAAAAGTLTASQLAPLRRLLGISSSGGDAEPEGILVVVYLDGGNDGMNTLVPLSDGRYHDLRRRIAIPAADTLALDGSYGLHPSLAFVHEQWARGQVAFIRGIGYSPANLSHFSSVDQWNAGRGAPGSALPSTPQSGWLGRWADLVEGANPFRSATIGNQVPLMMRGERRSSLLVPLVPASLLGATDGDLNERWVSTAMRSIAAQPTGAGPLADSMAVRTVRALDAAQRVSTTWTDALTGTPISRQLVMAANLINADVGTRVVSVGFDGFDTHARQPLTHHGLLADLDQALSQFFRRLQPRFAANVSVMTYSEFGRRPAANDSDGTDHGTSSVAMVLGANVAGAMIGDVPSLQSLDDAGNPAVTVDFRSLYSTLVAGWLDADPEQVIGARHELLPLFAAPPGRTVPPRGPPSTVANTSKPSVPAVP